MCARHEGHPGRHAEAERLIDRDPDALLVAIVDGAVVGTLIVGWDDWRCHLYRMAVDPAFRRSGIARVLVERACVQAASFGAARVDAMVDDGNADARAFWAEVGFTRDTEDRRWSRLI